MNQPDLHHDGPITVDLCDDLTRQLNERIGQLPHDQFIGGRLDPDWPECRNNWLDQMSYAKTRLAEVRADVEAGRPMLPHYHGKIIDNCLCVVRDFDRAKALDFTNPDFKE